MGDFSMFGFNKKGQGATEYLVLLAVVLIVAMVAIALLGFFPGLAGDAKISQSDTYWRGSARPFAILEHSFVSDNQNLTVVLQNVDSDQREVTEMSIAGSGFNGIANSTAGGVLSSSNTRFFSAGEKKTLKVEMSGNCTSGTIYEFMINFTYNTNSGLTGLKQYGEKALVGKCS